jgi:hypothetical protein
MMRTTWSLLHHACQIKIEGRNFVKGDDGYIMTKPRMALLQGGENDELMVPQNISASN